MLGMKQAMKSGIGCSGIRIGRSIVLSALTAVNAFGDIVDYRDRQILAGTRTIGKNLVKIGTKGYFADSLALLKTRIGKGIMSLATKTNTIIGVIATNATLDKEDANRLADAASNGIALSVQPAFTMLDGGTVFSMATGTANININVLLGYAPFVFADAIANAVLNCESIGDLPSARDKPRSEDQK